MTINNIDSVLTKSSILTKITLMDKVVTIHEAKTHLSKYIKEAQSGQPVYIGGYGKAEVMLVPAKNSKKILNIGLLKGQKPPYKDEDIIGSDPDILKDFEDSLNRPFPQ